MNKMWVPFSVMATIGSKYYFVVVYEWGYEIHGNNFATCDYVSFDRGR